MTETQDSTVAISRALLEKIEKSWRVPDSCPTEIWKECQAIIGDGLKEVRAILAQPPKPFAPALVERDKYGWWWHPGVPNFGDGEDPAPYYAWVVEQGLELKGWHSGDETYDLPEEDAACTAWNPESPGPEWFLMGIFDTEDGPYVQWARRVVTP